MLIFEQLVKTNVLGGYTAFRRQFLGKRSAAQMHIWSTNLPGFRSIVSRVSIKPVARSTISRIPAPLAITLCVGLAIREGLRPSPCLVTAVPIGLPRTPNIEPPRLSRRRGPTPGLPEGDIWILLP